MDIFNVWHVIILKSDKNVSFKVFKGMKYSDETEGVATTKDYCLPLICNVIQFIPNQTLINSFDPVIIQH